MTESTPSKPTILVVDDSRLMRVAARKILNSDYEIIDAEDGEIAWQKLQDHVDIIMVMSDLSMPNLDGLGLLKKIRTAEQPRLRDLPVIIVTGAEDDDGSKSLAFSAGASDFITKPFESVKLLARSKAQVKQHQTQLALQRSETSKRVLAEQSTLDSLTGLVNKRAFVNAIEEQLSYAIRHRTELSLLLIRLNKYKILFLRQGKEQAEDTLKQVASLVSGGRRREDTVARIGLDILGMTLPSANRIGAARVGEQLCAAIASHNFGDNREPPVVSVGISRLAIAPDVKAEDLLDDAMNALDEKPTVSVPILPPEPEMTGIPEQNRVAAPAQVASAEEVKAALQALSTGSSPAGSPEELARAIIPVLELWNDKNHNQYDEPIKQLKSALDLAASEDTAPSANSLSVESV